MARRRRRSWLAKRAEPENHVPTTRKRRRRRRSWLAKRADTSYIIYRYRYIPVYTLLLRLYDCTHRFGIPLLTAADFLFFLFFDPRITPAGPQTKFRPPFCKDGIFYFCVLAHHNWGGGAGRGGVGGWVGAARVWSHTRQSPSTQLKYALHVCFSRRKLFKEVRSPPSIYPSHFLRSKE